VIIEDVSAIQNMSFQNNKTMISVSRDARVERLSTERFSTEVKEPNPHCAAGNARQAKIISWTKQHVLCKTA